MGNSRFRLFHVMPNVWFYKLRDFGRFRDCEGRFQRSNSIRDEAGISLPRGGYQFGVNHKASQEHKSQVKKSSRAERSRKCESSTFIDSRVSVGCSCTTSLGFIWHSTERDDYTSTESSDDDDEEGGGKPVSFYSKQPMLVLQKQKNTTGEFKESLDNCELESESGMWKKPSKHDLQYIHNNAAGLPSPVQEFDDGQPEQPLKEMFELAGNPLVMDTASCSGRFGSSSHFEHNAALSNEGVSFYNINSQDRSSTLVMEMEKKQRCIAQGLEENRRRNAELESMFIKGKQKQISPTRKKVDAGTRFQAELEHKQLSSFNSNNAVEVQQGPINPGKSTSQLSIKTDQNNTRVSSSSSLNLNYIDRESIVKQRSDSGEKSAVFDSFVEVKSSYNPHKDFRESMLEMITEKDIHGSQDLEKLLECYLSLNSHEYHDIILQVFDQVNLELKGISS